MFYYFFYIKFIKFLEAHTDADRVNRALDEDLLLLVSRDENRVHQKLMAHPKQQRKK